MYFIALLSFVSLCSSNTTNSTMCTSGNCSNSTVHSITSSPVNFNYSMKTLGTTVSRSNSRLSISSSSLSSSSSSLSISNSRLSSSSSSTAANSVLPTSPPSPESPTTKDSPTSNFLYLSVGVAGVAAFMCSLVMCGTTCLLAKNVRQIGSEDLNKKMASTKDGLEMEDLSETQTHETKKTAGANEDLDDHKVPSKESTVTSEEGITKQEPGAIAEDGEKPSEALSKSLEAVGLDKQSIARSECSQVLEVEVDGKFYAVDVTNKPFTVSENPSASLKGSLGDHCSETST